MREGKGRGGEGEAVGIKSWEIGKRKRRIELPREGYGTMVNDAITWHVVL